MVKRTIVSYTITDYNRYLVNPNKDVEESERIEITSDFQRGSEDLGVWNLDSKRKYIESIEKMC